MAEENIVPPGDQPIRIRWLNAAEHNPTVQRPVAQHPPTPAIKMNKVTAPSVINKAKTKVASVTNVVRFADQITPSNADDMPLQSSRGLKELSAEDKLKIANLIKELARIGHEKELVESKLEQERKLFESQMKTMLTDYDKLMKDNQKLLTRYNETKTILNEIERRSQLSSRTHEFPNPQRSSTPIELAAPKEPPPIQRPANVVLNEQFHLKQQMMEKQLQLLHKQQQILERELQQRNANTSLEHAGKPIQTITRSTSPLKPEPKILVTERATSPVKQTKAVVRTSDRQPVRSVQTQRPCADVNDEDLLILSLNESLHEPLPPKNVPTHRPSHKPVGRTPVDSDEQNLLKDIFFIC